MPTPASPNSLASLASSGRAASLERRRALSAGKSALPPAAERVRNGQRSAALPSAAGPAAGGTATVVATAETSKTTGNPAVTNRSLPAGRVLSMERRRLLAAGKRALLSTNSTTSSAPSSIGPSSSAPPNPAPAHDCAADCCKSQARARRALLSARGRGDAPAAVPSRPPREGRLEYAPKVVDSITHGRQTVTGSRIGTGSQVTGVESGASLPVSGTQYIGREAGLASRGVGGKVGHARTFGGVVVSGTLIRSKVPITGDEAGSTISVTGEAEQRPEDDLCERGRDSTFASAQFQRQVDPHGHSVFGTNVGRSIRHIGSRERQREAPLEATDGGLAITGSAIGRAVRVTGDEDGACRQITGDQYLSPARAQAECGGSGGGTAPAAQLGAMRRDPVTGAKVRVAATWGEQRITGADVEHDARVTGDAPGSCALITGTPYQGPRTVHAWCEPAAGQAAEHHLSRRAATAAVTGDTPMHAEAVTGTSRGAARAITGTPYYRDATARRATDSSDDARTAPRPLESIAAIDAGFSVHSPQRTAQLRDRSTADSPGDVSSGTANRITGAFAIQCKKLTGNLEFTFRPRNALDREAKPAHTRVSGEGRNAGTPITGDPWAAQKNVTGIENFTAVERNPSMRDGKPHTFAGAAQFKSRAVKEEPKQLVTGMFGWSSKSAAKVTLSGGAHG